MNLNHEFVHPQLQAQTKMSLSSGRRWIFFVFSLVCSVMLVAPYQAQAAGMSFPTKACEALQSKYPMYKGKTLVNAINPHTPGYEALDPNDPSKYIGLDIDLGEAIGQCLGLSYGQIWCMADL